MKTIGLILAFFLPLGIFGQATDHFVNSDSKWYVAKSYPNATQQYPTFVGTRTTVYGFQGDSLISGDSWLKLYSSSDSLFNNNLVFHGLIRSFGDSVQFIDTNSQLHLLYDFTLNIGDSVLYNFDWFSEMIAVVDIDSILVNGEYYKRFYFSEPTAPSAFEYLEEIWIEGIGSLHGPIFPYNPERFYSEIPDSLLLLCTETDDQKYWQNPHYTRCFINITSLGIDPNAKYNFSVFPNPFTEIIKIETEFTGELELSVTDYAGRELLSREPSSDNLTLDLSFLEPGLYFIHLRSGTQIVAQKILKQY